MQGVVLAAGEGTRPHPLTENKPKGMLEVTDKPILTHCFEQLVELGAEKPDDPLSNLTMTGFYTFSTAIFHACELVQPSDRDEYELSDAIDLLNKSGRAIDAIPMEGWRIDVGYPDDRDEAEERLEDLRAE